MKKNLGLFLLLLILAAGAFYIYNGQGTSTLDGEGLDFAVKDTASITKIFLADKAGNTVLLEKKNASNWSLNGNSTARLDAIKNLLGTMAAMRVKAPVPRSAFEAVVKRLASNSTKVEIYQGSDVPSKVYFVGGANQQHNGTYMLMKGSEAPFLMHIEGFHGYINPRFFTNSNEWKSTKVFAYNFGEIASVEVEYPKESHRSFKIVDDGDHKAFHLYALGSENEVPNFDVNKVRGYLTRYKKIHYEGFEETRTQDYRDSVLASTPLSIVRVKDTEGVEKEVKTYLKPLPGGEDLMGNAVEYDVDRLYGLINDEDFVVLQYFVFDPLAVSLVDFSAQLPVDN